MRDNILFIFGTRPEAIKLAPLIWEFRKYSNEYDIKVCITAQHREMLDQVMKFFKLEPDFDLNIMKPNQSLFYLTSSLILKIENVLRDFNPDLVIVQGDTTTTLVGALAAFYNKSKIAHIEAGLRSSNKYSPFPEEINRKLTGHMADYHFAPTEKSKLNLYKEGITKNIWVVGNTAIDSLFLGLDLIKKEGEDPYCNYFNYLDFSKKIILVTSHRRENFGEPLRNVCQAIKEISEEFKDIEFVFPVHLNPNVRKSVNEILKGKERIHLVDPLPYPLLIWLMNKSYLVLTDSGGIQEEAPSLGKPVLVLRNVTERIEGIEAGTAKLVGTDKEKIKSSVKYLLENKEAYLKMSKAVNPYGDGKASKRIVKILKEIME